jgi:hypothetical protein
MVRLSVLMFLISGGFFGLFWADYTGVFDQIDQPIGQVRMAQGAVRRLGKEALTWDRSSLGSLLGRGDTVAVGEQGFAQLVIFEGAMLELDAGSMVTLAPGPDALELNFLAGGGTVKLTKEAKQRINVKSTSSKSAKQPAVKVQEVAKEEIIPTQPTAKQELTKIVKKAIETKKLEIPTVAKSAPPIEASSIRNPASILDTGGEIITRVGVPEPPKVMFADFIEQTGGVIDVGEMRRKGAVPELTWVTPEQTDVIGYEVRFSPVDGKTAPKSYRTLTPSLGLDRVKPGRYLWSVRQISSRGRRGSPTEPQYLEILASKQRKIVFELPDKPVGGTEE